MKSQLLNWYLRDYQISLNRSVDPFDLIQNLQSNVSSKNCEYAPCITQLSSKGMPWYLQSFLNIAARREAIVAPRDTKLGSYKLNNNRRFHNWT